MVHTKKSRLRRDSAQKGRLAGNWAWSIADFITGIAAGLWFTPFLIRTLGADAFGLVPLATAVIGYLAVVTVGLNAAVGRNLTIAVEAGKHEDACRIFNTSLWGSIAMGAALTIPGIFVSWYAPCLINTPAGYETSVRWLFAAALLSFLLGVISTPFGVASYCLNRFDISNLISIIQRIVFIGVTAAVFLFAKPTLGAIAAAMALSAVVSLISKVWAQLRILPFLRVNWRQFDLRVFRELFTFGGWIVINYVGAVLYMSIDLLVVNRMLGPSAGGDYAVAMQWSNLLRTFGGVVAGVFGPTILYYYARKDILGLAVYGRRVVKLVGLCLALPMGLVCGLAEPLLRVWVGEEFVWLAGLVALLTGHLCINLAVVPLFNIQNATARVRLPGIVTCVTGLLSLGLAILLTGPAGFGIYGPALAGCVMLTAKNATFTPIYCARILGLPWWTFTRGITSIALLTGAIWFISLTATHWIELASWGQLIGVVATATIVYVFAVWQFILSPDERTAVLGGFLVRTTATNSGTKSEGAEVTK